jgi:predicted 3-demethylubiquinone-9 3-methyltransferase (glyoxalase superfamily)
MESIATHLWFDKSAREAAEWYVSQLPGSRIKSVAMLHNTPSGDTELVSFDLGGRPFMAISAGPLFTFNPSVSLHVKRPTKEAVDATWNGFAEGGRVLMPLGTYPFNERFGWVQDKYGVSWQIMLAPIGEDHSAIVPALMFTEPVAGQAEAAMTFYTSVFKSPPPKVLSRYGTGDAPDRDGTVRIASFTLPGGEFAAMDSAHRHGFTFNEAISFVVPCETQEEIDYYWGQLSFDPKAEQCGWLKDRYGLSWQITPTLLGRMLDSGDQARTARVTRALLQMKKFDIAALERVYNG